MAIRQLGQLTLADALVERRGKSSVTLEQLDGLIDWPAVAVLLGGLRGSRDGAPAYPPLTLLKGLLLQQWYALSDPGLEDALADRLSFRRFVGLALDERAPDHSTICRFRALLVAEGLTERIFVEVTRQIDAHGLILRQGTMIDASLIEAQVKRPKKPKDAATLSADAADAATVDAADGDRDAEAREWPASAEPASGKLASGKPAPSKLVPSETDPEASWARKGGKLYFGYKAHIAADLFSGIIRRCRMTTASVADTTPADDLVMGDEAAIYADKAYDTKRRRAALKARGIKDRIAHRPNRHHPLSARQEQRNAGIGRRRSGVERPFATMEVRNDPGDRNDPGGMSRHERTASRGGGSPAPDVDRRARAAGSTRSRPQRARPRPGPSSPGVASAAKNAPRSSKIGEGHIRKALARGRRRGAALHGRLGGSGSTRPSGAKVAHSLLLVFFAALTALPARAADLTLTLTGDNTVVYDSRRDACADIDVPDINPRAYRDAKGDVVMFALHYVNRPLRGPDLTHLKIDCHVSLDSALDGNPAHYDDRRYIAATWTTNGADVSALVHEEYHADDHKTCRVTDSLGCWYNTVLAVHSTDGGASFAPSRPLVVASAPFKQDVEQGRHRGFLNPSNMFADGRFTYAFISTTGWDGQAAGNCLFRTENPADSGSWRAWDGARYAARFESPYFTRTRPRSCQTVEPFLFPVGAVVRDARRKLWIAIFQAAPGPDYPVDGFYYATAHDLLHWSAPRLLMAGSTLYGDLCKAGSTIINYPSILDPGSTSRNFDTIGDRPLLFFDIIAVDKCETTQRLLVYRSMKLEGR